jgi:spore coat polysaccharide biosynthesis predicted glycosyltransferase SpsG
MRFIFRADASLEIGSGHVMRSSVLAEELISRGFECVFIGSIVDLDWVTERISTLGFRQVLSDEASFVRDAQTDVLVLDSYSIPVSNSFIAKMNWKFSMSICDEITPNYLVDIELRPGFEKTREGQLTPIVLSGTEHLLIRQGIFKSSGKKYNGGTTRVLVLGGGSDTFGFVPAVAEVIHSLKLNLEVHLFTNAEILTKFSWGLFVHPIGSELDIIARDVDVVLTTASTSSFEFIAREIPTGVVCAIDNQESYYKQLGRLGYATQIGVRTFSGDWEFNVEAIGDLLGDQKKRDALKQSVTGLIDLKGAERVVDFLLEFNAY